MGRAKFIEHGIDTGDARPTRQTLRKFPKIHQDLIDEQVKLMLRQDLIQPANSEWASNVVLVKKRDDSWRFCVDYRSVNAKTIKDAYPLPRISDCIDTLTGSVWFTTLDMRSGFFQVKIKDSDAHKTAFITRTGAYQFKFMAQGLSNSSATFQRLLNLVLTGLNYVQCMTFIDDIIIYSATVGTHLERLEAVLLRIKAAGLKLRPEKCKILRKRVRFLGHIISEQCVTTDDEKIRAVSSWPVPAKLKSLRSFLGLCCYYRRFVKGFAELAAPLHALTRKNCIFRWTEECQKSFEGLKNRLTSAPIMAFPRDEGLYTLDTDASDQTLGGVLSQNQGGVDRVIAYASRMCSKPERNYCVTRKELLAVVYFTRNFRQYLLGRHFVIRTDHSALQWLKKTPEPIGQQARWLEQLESFDYEIVHRKGVLHGNADALSHRR